MGMRRSRMVELEQRWSWLIGRGRLQGKWKDYTAGKSRKRSKRKENSQIKKRGLSKKVRKVMGRSVNWEDEWEEEEELVVGELGRRMVAEGWSMGEEALVKERRVTGRESTALAWVSKNSIAPELSQIQPFSSYLDSAKCNLDENTKAAWVHARYKCDAKKVKPVPLSDESIPDARLDWRGRAIARAVPIPGPWDKWFIPRFSHGARGGRLTPERLRELRIGSILWPKEEEALLGMILNREYAL